MKVATTTKVAPIVSITKVGGRPGSQGVAGRRDQTRRALEQFEA